MGSILFCMFLLLPLLQCEVMDEDQEQLESNTPYRLWGKCTGIKVSYGGKIVGGTTTNLNDFPWMAKLIYKKQDGRRKVACAGSLISPKYVLTAAHCIPATSSMKTALGDLYMIELGVDETEATNSNEEDFNGRKQFIEVDKTIRHENFGLPQTSYIDDIAIVQLKENAIFNKFVQPACVFIGDVPANSQLWVSGWGRTEDGNPSNIKLKVTVPFVDLEECNATWSKRKMTITSNQICAGGFAGKDSCEGDSGGPLMLLKNSQWFVVGLVSFGSGICGEAGIPAVHTNIGKYMEWIIKNII